MVDEYHQKGWPLHVLLNNAGIQVRCYFASSSPWCLGALACILPCKVCTSAVSAVSCLHLAVCACSACVHVRPCHGSTESSTDVCKFCGRRPRGSAASKARLRRVLRCVLHGVPAQHPNVSYTHALAVLACTRLQITFGTNHFGPVYLTVRWQHL